MSETKKKTVKKTTTRRKSPVKRASRKTAVKKKVNESKPVEKISESKVDGNSIITEPSIEDVTIIAEKLKKEVKDEFNRNTKENLAPPVQHTAKEKRRRRVLGF